MKKKLAALLITGIMAAAMTACGSSNSGTDNSGSTDGTAKTESSADAGSDWDNTSDITVVSREDGSGTRGAFVELFGIEEEVNGEKVDMTTEEANITNSTSVMMSTVAQDEYAIGYISLGSLDDSVKAVKVDGSEATAENIKNGSYKISRPFNIATKEDLSDAAQDFEDFILSTEGQKVVEDNKYIPLDDVSDYKSNGASGKVVAAAVTALCSVTLGVTPVCSATRFASSSSKPISCKNFVPWHTPTVMFCPVMVMLLLSRKPLMGTPSRFMSSSRMRKACSSSMA